MSSPAASLTTAERHASAPIFDGHNDLAWKLRLNSGPAGDQLDIRRSRPDLHTDLDRLREGGVGAQFWSVWVPGTLPEDTAVRTVVEQIDLVKRLVARFPSDLQFAVTADDVLRARQSGHVASLLGAEGGRCIAGSTAVLRMLADLGLRYMTLTHNESLVWADSATADPIAGGLSDLGREIVREMNRVGVIVDLSHVAATTMNDALDCSTVPVMFSHSSAYAVAPHPRNVPDDVLSRLSVNGGLCMVTFVPEFVSTRVADWTQARASNPGDGWLARNPVPSASISEVADHVEHVREVAGIDHVGLGGDYDGCPVMPEGLRDVACYPVLIEELIGRGWSHSEIEKLAWSNMIRVLADTPPVG